jgi:hypothetical protein
MLRRSAQRLWQQGWRSLSTSAALREGEAAAPAGVKEFTEAWAKAAPSTMNVPEFPSQFLEAEAAEGAVDGEKFPVNFYTPSGVIAENKVI